MVKCVLIELESMWVHIRTIEHGNIAQTNVLFAIQHKQLLLLLQIKTFIICNSLVIGWLFLCYSFDWYIAFIIRNCLRYIYTSCLLSLIQVANVYFDSKTLLFCSLIF